MLAAGPRAQHLIWGEIAARARSAVGTASAQLLGARRHFLDQATGSFLTRPRAQRRFVARDISGRQLAPLGRAITEVTADGIRFARPGTSRREEVERRYRRLDSLAP